MKVKSIVLAQKKFFHTNKTKDIRFRKRQLKRLRDEILRREEDIYQALKQDLNKSEYEAYLTELGLVLSEITTALRKLEHWMKPEKVDTPLSCYPASSYILREPYGSVLILAPWNYPFQLAMTPLVGAIAAGNCVVIKTSKHSKYTTKLISQIVEKIFPPYYVACVSDEDYDEILAARYDYIFFTGSERVGKIVMKAASRYVTPISLELGGKSPCIVDETANIKIAARRIIWGKMLNSGQTCVAPDYILVNRKVKNALLLELQRQMALLCSDYIHNEDYPKIISKDHFERLVNEIENEETKIGGHYDEETNKIQMTIFPEATFQSLIMKEEIFGPILPVITYTDVDDMLMKVKTRKKPLACYIFTERKEFYEKVLHEVSFGGGCVNDVIMHLANDKLPFGGVGSSGMGNYHGEYSFRTFSHEKSILKNPTKMDLPFRYPPFRKEKLSIIRRLMK